MFKGKRFMNKVVKKKVSRGWEGKSERLRAFFQAAYSGLTIDSIIATRAFSFLSKTPKHALHHGDTATAPEENPAEMLPMKL